MKLIISRPQVPQFSEAARTPKISNRGLENLRPALLDNQRWAPRKLLIPEP